MTQLHLDDANLPSYLASMGMPLGEPARVEPAGDGNINWVRRAFLADGTSVVVKQARPALERFPQYEVPTERILFEARYYARARALEPRRVCPEVLRFDSAQRVLVLEDLGRAERLDAALARGASVDAACATLGAFLAAVHEGTRGAALADEFHNDAMRRLHGDHIFALPLRENDFPLSPALRRRAAALRAEPELVAAADATHARYLEARGALVHADVQAGNVLLTATGPRLLDAEIAHLGDPAFDLGTLLAHLCLPALARGRAEAARAPVRAAWDAYRKVSAAPAFAEVARYAGLEMLRRTIGAARVAAVERDEAALAVLEAARRLVLAPPEGVEGLV